MLYWFLSFSVVSVVQVVKLTSSPLTGVRELQLQLGALSCIEAAGLLA